MSNTKAESYYQLDFASRLQTKIYYHLIECQEQTALEIAKALGLKIPTVTARLNELQNMCLVYISGVKFNAETERNNHTYKAETDLEKVKAKVEKSLEHCVKHLEQLSTDIGRIEYASTYSIIQTEINNLNGRIGELNEVLRKL